MRVLVKCLIVDKWLQISPRNLDIHSYWAQQKFISRLNLDFSITQACIHLYLFFCLYLSASISLVSLSISRCLYAYTSLASLSLSVSLPISLLSHSVSVYISLVSLSLPVSLLPLFLFIISLSKTKFLVEFILLINYLLLHSCFILVCSSLILLIETV